MVCPGPPLRTILRFRPLKPSSGETTASRLFGSTEESGRFYFSPSPASESMAQIFIQRGVAVTFVKKNLFRLAASGIALLSPAWARAAGPDLPVSSGDTA